ICRAFVESTTLSENELFQQLREHGIEQLGEVAHAYVETDGVLTVFRSKKARPGLPIVPPWEIQPPIEVEPSESDDGGVPLACKQCGAVADTGTVTCPHC